jgi:hypothetical protein
VGKVNALPLIRPRSVANASMEANVIINRNISDALPQPRASSARVAAAATAATAAVVRRYRTNTRCDARARDAIQRRSRLVSDEIRLSEANFNLRLNWWRNYLAHPVGRSCRSTTSKRFYGRSASVSAAAAAPPSSAHDAPPSREAVETVQN